MSTTTEHKYTSQFIYQLDQLVTKLSNQFPKEQDIKYLMALVSGLKLIKPSELVSQYYIKIYKYKDQIKSRDEKYFLITSFDEDIDKDADKSIANMKIDYFKKLLTSGSVLPDTKNVIWTYLIMLNMMMEKMILIEEFKVPSA